MQVVSETEGVLRMDGPVGPLEVRIEASRGADIGVDLVICHPHPLHGGSLDNKVVHTLARAARDVGCRAVRFNFRGVGGSVGQHDDGRGEIDDLLAVMAGCEVQAPGRLMALAGFSFGAWVAAATAARTPQRVRALLLVAPPVHYGGFDALVHFGMPVQVIQGDDDDVVDAEDVQNWCASRQPPVPLLLMPAGHFFHGALPALKNDAASWLAAALSPMQCAQ
jgi:alpha/beta superfamily hydrolase